MYSSICTYWQYIAPGPQYITNVTKFKLPLHVLFHTREFVPAPDVPDRAQLDAFDTSRSI
jgi:hypothetical protein